MRHILLALAALVVILFFAKPASPWEFDEPLFFQALQKYDPVAHHPPPPGYPVFIGVAKIVRFLIPSDFGTLVTISSLGSAIAFVLLARAFGELAGNTAAGIAGAAMFYFSPALLVHSTLPISEPGALALLSAALFFLSRRDLPLFALFAALTVGWRPQFSIFVLPLFFTGLLTVRTAADNVTSRVKRVLIALAVFTVVCTAWLVPLASAVGGINALIRFESSQAGYLAEHDADVSRSGWTPAATALRFVAHPWGTKVASFPVLLVAAIGVWQCISLRDARRSAIPIAVASVIYIVFAFLVMDPADGVRYAIPFVLGTSFFAGIGAVTIARRFDAPAYALVVMFAIASLVYVSSFLSQRSSSPSPVVQAAMFARRTFPENASVLYELPLWPHSQYYFRDRKPMRVNEGMAAFFDRPDVPLFLYADGVSHAPGARVFRWQPSDAYSKLTRNHYRVASVIPIEPEQRFRIVRGVYTPEREQDGEEWRWLDSPAEIQLPHGPARTLTLRIGLPVIYPMESNELTIRITENGPQRAASQLSSAGLRVVLKRGEPVTVSLSVRAGGSVITFESARTFIPAEVPGSLNRDRRRLAVKLYDLHTTSAAADEVPQVASR